jgi:AcrR family transcriptional regulator
MATRSKSGDTANNAAVDRGEEALHVALGLFLERGYDNTPMSLIAKRLKLTKAGVYHHFESKEELLYLIHRRNVEQLLLPVIEKSERLADPEERLRAFLLEFSRLLTRDPSARILIGEAKRLSPRHFAEIRNVWRRGFQLVRGALQELQRAKRCRSNLNATFAAFAAIGMCSWISYWFDHSRPRSGDEVAAAMVDVFMCGIVPRA